MRKALRLSVFLASVLASSALAASDTIAADPVRSPIKIPPLPSAQDSPQQSNSSPLVPFRLPSGTTPNSGATPNSSSPRTQEPLTNQPTDADESRSTLEIHQRQTNPFPQVRQHRTNETPQVRQKDQDSFQLPPRLPVAEPKIRRYEPTLTGATGRVRGQASVKPICSVVSVSTDCVARPYVGTLNVVSLDRAQRIQIRTDSQGEFELQLVEGIYLLEPATGAFPSLSQQRVRIIPGTIREEAFAFEGNVPESQPLGVSSPTVRATGQLESSSLKKAF